MAALSQPAQCTSAQTDWTEPVPLVAEKMVRGKAMFGVLGGSDLYDSVGNLGATFDIGDVKGGDIYFFGDVLTWITNPKLTDFEPRRVVYTLEAGYISPVDDQRYSLFVKHQSFHDVDSSDGIDESYELYGFRYRISDEPAILLRVGKYANRSAVDYDWDFAVGSATSLGSISDRQLYASAWVHHVTESGNPDRDGFTDYFIEVGVEFLSGIDVFVRYELLHDLDRFDGTTDHHLVLGTKYIW